MNTTKQISPELKAFFVALQSWIEQKEESEYHYVFTNSSGTCCALVDWNTYTGAHHSLRQDLMNELSDLMENKLFPFNSHPPDFSDEYRDDTTWFNSKRLAFIKFHSQSQDQ